MSSGARWLRSPLALLLALTALGTLCAWALARAVPEHAGPPPAATPLRLASLAPAITETLFAIGAGQELVAVSDYCDHPAAVARLPRVGTGITPDYERLARLAPSLILTDGYAAGSSRQLSAIADTVPLPWLTLQQVTTSIDRLGALTGHRAAAGRLAALLRARLGTEPAPDAPRVLLVQANPALLRGQVWFIKDNSLHGAALRAAGGRNAARGCITGPAQMSLERLLELDPDWIVVLADEPYTTEQARQHLLATVDSWRELRAARLNQVSVIQGQGVFATGPRILDLVEQLATVLGTRRSSH